MFYRFITIVKPAALPNCCCGYDTHSLRSWGEGLEWLTSILTADISCSQLQIWTLLLWNSGFMNTITKNETVYLLKCILHKIRWSRFEVTIHLFESAEKENNNVSNHRAQKSIVWPTGTSQKKAMGKFTLSLRCPVGQAKKIIQESVVSIYGKVKAHQMIWQ